MENNELLKIKEEVEKRLREQGVAVYFIAFEHDEGNPYFAYTFDKELLNEAIEDWKQGLIPENCFDDYSFEVDFEERVVDICKIILEKKDERKGEVK